MSFFLDFLNQNLKRKYKGKGKDGITQNSKSSAGSDL